MFATEPVTASLAGLLQDKDEQERAGGVAGRPSRYVVEEADGQRRRRELEIDELEIQKGLLQVAQGLEFLHESVGLVHGNLTPEAIYVNVKVCGLGIESFRYSFGILKRTRASSLVHWEADVRFFAVRLEDCWAGFCRATRQFQFPELSKPYLPFGGAIP